MRMRKNFATGAALAAAAAMALTACGGTGTVDTGTQLNVGPAYTTTDYGPLTSSALAMGSNWQVLEGLYRLDRTDYSVTPALASGDPVKVSDTEYEVTLREGAKFSDGTDVSAADVVAAYGKATAEGSLFAQFYTFVDSVEAKDDKTVTIHLKYPFAALKERFAILMVTPASADADAMKAKPIGSGPYKYTEVGEQKIVAVPNEHYNGNTPATVDTINWNPLKDDAARLTAALDGTIDVVESVPASSQKDLTDAGWTVESKPGYGNAFMMFNTQKAPFDQPEVRRAFLKAINKKAIIETALDGEAVEATSFLPEVSSAYKKPTTDLSYDKDAAAQLLNDAGVSGMKVNLLTTDHPWIVAMVPQITADLEALGLTVNHTSQATGDLYSNVTDVKDAVPSYDVIIAPGDPSVFGNDPGIIISWWNGNNNWTKQRDGWQVSDPESFNQLQTIIEEAGQLEGDAANAKWGEAQDLLAEKTVLYPLVFRNVLTGSNPAKVQGFHAIPTTGLQLVGVNVQ
ncbi:ABC transporter substrate-binding protein [Actinomyces bouchesdurhonensis]|uniref:ABC transporter substrate-binding protein n=1 Tax=Actinomyces bouchesdurhonensis TaxID=1852361 RepID=UPI0023F14DB6|nr:ABC transporter substrate-binding protein [Actinomyces bouchesdurhonensis]